MEKILYNRDKTEILGIYSDINEDMTTFLDKANNQFDVPTICLECVLNMSDFSMPSLYYIQKFTIKN